MIPRSCLHGEGRAPAHLFPPAVFIDGGEFCLTGSQGLEHTAMPKTEVIKISVLTKLGTSASCCGYQSGLKSEFLLALVFTHTHSLILHSSLPFQTCTCRGYLVSSLLQVANLLPSKTHICHWTQHITQPFGAAKKFNHARHGFKPQTVQI